MIPDAMARDAIDAARWRWFLAACEVNVTEDGHVYIGSRPGEFEERFGRGVLTAAQVRYMMPVIDVPIFVNAWADAALAKVPHD